MLFYSPKKYLFLYMPPYYIREYPKWVIYNCDHVANKGFTCATKLEAIDNSSLSSTVVSASTSAYNCIFKSFYVDYFCLFF